MSISLPTRREMLLHGGGGFGAVALAALMGPGAGAAEAETPAAAARLASKAGKAKSGAKR